MSAITKARSVTLRPLTTVRQHGRTAVLALHGKIDLHRVPDLRPQLLRFLAGCRDLVIDLADVAYIDSSGIASLVEALQAVRAAGGRLSLAAVSVPALRLLRLLRLDEVFVIHPDVRTALGAEAMGAPALALDALAG